MSKMTKYEQMCPHCLQKARRYFSHKVLPTFYRCTRCGLLFADTNAFRDESELNLALSAENVTAGFQAQFKSTFIEDIDPSDDQGTMYPSNEYIQGKLDYALFTRVQDAMAMHSIIPSDGQFSCLEIGCATGFLLNQIRRAYPNAETLGIEPSPVSGAKAKQLYGLDVFQGTLNTFNVEEYRNHFDVILIFGNLQLHSNPFSSLRLCHSMLRPGGLLLYESKNPNSAARRLGRLAAMLPLLRNTRLGTAIARSCFDGLRIAADKRLLKSATNSIGYHVLNVCTFPPRMLSVTNSHDFSQGVKGLLWRSLDRLDRLLDERAWIQVAATRRK